MSERPTTDQLHRAFLEAERAANPFDPHEIRLSATGGCPRQQTLRILDFPHDPETPEQLSIFHAGHYWEDYLASLWEQQFPGGVNRQVTVDTPYGTGHIDLWIEPIHHLVECKTTTASNVAHLPLEEHLDQVNLYLHFWGNAQQATAEIAYVIKETGNILTFPVTYDPDRIPPLIETLQAIQVAVTFDQTPLPIPDGYHPAQFPCSWRKKDGSWAHCGYWRLCWQADRPLPDEEESIVPAPAEWLPVLTEWQELSQHIADYKAILKPLEQRKKDLEDALQAWLASTHAQGLATAEGFLTCTEKKPSLTYDVKAALKDGVLTADQLAPYQKWRANGVSWTWHPAVAEPQAASDSPPDTSAQKARRRSRRAS
ncbi:hypothetical protein [Sulfobacillus thermosulfidooxidans]|uniref:hypothetical protein n=1 Tax=Sulfobacillus thermosulfidooxidans TaxID=28034 RepID=UPI0006B586C2|nr:hypothetical protein [Sulfobacillus thermosulfidooxidans]